MNGFRSNCNTPQPQHFATIPKKIPASRVWEPPRPDSARARLDTPPIHSVAGGEIPKPPIPLAFKCQR
jgi:hypothetical protein